MSSSPVHSEEEFDAFLSESDTRVIVATLGSEACHLCHQLQPELDTLADELHENDRDAKFVKVDRTEDTFALFERYEVTKLPTVLMLMNKELKKTLSRPDLIDVKTAAMSLIRPPVLVLDDDF